MRPGQFGASCCLVWLVRIFLQNAIVFWCELLVGWLHGKELTAAWLVWFGVGLLDWRWLGRLGTAVIKLVLACLLLARCEL